MDVPTSRTMIMPLDGETFRGAFIEVEVVDPEQDVLSSPLDIRQLVESVAGLASEFATALADAGPSKATLEVGVTAGVEAGKLVAILGKLSGSTTIKLTLEWER